MSKAFNILVTGCGGDIGQSIGKILLKSKYTKNLFGIDISNKNAAQFIYPNFSIGVPFTHPDYLQRLELFIDEHDIDLIIPIAEPELRFFSEQNILKGIGKAKMITASALALEIGFDKFKTAEFLKRENLPFPETFLAKSLKRIDNFPVILKSKTGSGSKDIHKINSIEDFLFHTKNTIDDYVVQEFISDEKGEFTCGVFRSSSKEIRTQIFKRELTGGYSGYGQVIKNKNITTLLENISKKINLRGSINVQLRIKDTIPYVFEINPRFSSTILFRHLFGFEDLIWSIEDLMDHNLSEYIPNENITKFYKGFQEYTK
jgi:carbamoyl-phosphate synthase large subunit